MNNLNQIVLRSGLAVLLISSVAACSDRSSAGLTAGDGSAVAGNGSSGAGGSSASGSDGSGGSAGGASADAGGSASGSGGSAGGSAGGTIAAGPQGPAGPAGPAGPTGPSAAVLAGALGGVAGVNAGGLQVGGPGPNGSPAPIAVSALGPNAAPNAPVSASVLSGQGNQVQGLLTGLTTTVSNPATLGNGVLATTQPLLGAAGTLPLLSQVTGGLLPNAPPGSVPLVGATLGQTALLGNGATPTLANAAVASPVAASGSPVTANVLSGGSGGAVTGGVLGGVTGTVGRVTGAVAPGGAPPSPAGGSTAARPVQGLVGGVLTTAGGLVGNTTGGLLRR